MESFLQCFQYLLLLQSIIYRLRNPITIIDHEIQIFLFRFSQNWKFLTIRIPSVYGHLQQIHLQRPSLSGSQKLRPLAAKPLAAELFADTFWPLAALALAAVHLQRNRPFAAKQHQLYFYKINYRYKISFYTGLTYEWQNHYGTKKKRECQNLKILSFDWQIETNWQT